MPATYIATKTSAKAMVVKNNTKKIKIIFNRNQ